MIRFETVKKLVDELKKWDGKRKVFVKEDGYHYGVADVYIDEDGDVILEIEE